jgi:aldose 1-epimerase
MGDVGGPTAASGAQHELENDGHRAVVAEVGATLRHYSAHDVDVIDGFDADEVAPAGRGQVLAPWPNRLDGGRYEYEGRTAHAALDEPERGNAIHGLVRWLPWTVDRKQATAVRLACVLHPQPGYPWLLGLQIDFRLDGDGLTVSTRIENRSEVAAPFGFGFHPYLTVGVAADEATLVVPAARRLVADERGLPMGEADVAGTPYEFRKATTIGSVRLDTCYTDLHRGPDGLARAVLGAPHGDRSVTLWADERFRYLMVYTGDTLEPVPRRRRAVAIEPMTCPPNALRSGTDLLRIEPGGVVEARWGLVPGSDEGGSRT